ncbi:MAG TPA: tyrosine-type recombinase/integrase [Opitutaceae bacterium]|nr:tyrosine-type recombinase/integrase [Opitutaceae bacterium]
MASLRNFPGSPYFFACFTDATGRRVQRSTKQSKRRTAQAIADAWEKAAKLGSEKRLSEAQARRILSQIYETVNDEPLPSSTTSEFLTNWAAKRKLDTSPRTHQAYAQIVRDFLSSLGERASRDISQISKADVTKYRDSVLARTSKASANKAVKYLRVALGAAFKDGLSQDNAAAKVDVLRRVEEDRRGRRPFTIEEVKLLLDQATGEWRGLILFGFYTGQRLGDIARLRWTNVDLQKKEIHFRTKKTDRMMILPLHPVLQTLVEDLPTSDDPTAFLFPQSAPLASGVSGDSRLSQQFHSIMVSAGLAEKRTKDATGEGRAQRRNASEVSFHSLRHTATSLLKNAGVSEAITMDIIGHDSKAVSRHYTRVEEQTKRDALSKLPHLS